jgi:hypothetical protein
MSEAGVESRPQTGLPGTLSWASRPLKGDELEGVPGAPALMRPPLLGVLRRPDGDESTAILRLVVPVPISEVDEVDLGRIVWQLATAANVGVLLLAKVAGPEDEWQVRRRLTTLAALVRRRPEPVETAIVHQRTWIRALRLVLRAGDVVLCPTRDSLGRGKPDRRELADQVVDELHRPAYVLDDFRMDLSDPWRLRLRGILGRSEPLVVLAVFGLVQSQIVFQTQGLLQTLLLVTTVGVELGTLLYLEGLVS